MRKLTRHEAEELAPQIEQGEALLAQARLIGDVGDYEGWRASRKQWADRAAHTLRRLGAEAGELGEFDGLASSHGAAGEWQTECNSDAGNLRRALDLLISLGDRAEAEREDLSRASKPPGGAAEPDPLPEPERESSGHEPSPEPSVDPSQIFLVQGRNQRLKQAVAGLLEQTGESQVTILSERPEGPRALVESSGETAPARRYAVVLLTADDVGAPRLDGDREPHFSIRARQGAVFEMGILVAALTPGRVCVLYEDGVELPCDLDGVAYVRLDRAGSWRLRLLLHLRGAGFEHDLNSLAPA
jgi:hypothetical protein